MKKNKLYSYLFSLLVGVLLAPASALAQCTGNFQADIQNAPTLLGQTVTSICIPAGDYLSIIGLQAGYTYEISTCTYGTFDTQLSLYDAGFINLYAYSDDDCSVQSFISFTPTISGDYDVAMTEYYCVADPSLCSEIEVTLVNIPYAPPANDQPCAAIPLNNNTTYSYINLGATADFGEVVPPFAGCNDYTGWCEAGVQTSIWFSFVAPASGSININTCNANTDFNTQVAIYEVVNCNDYTTFTFVAGNDDGTGCVAADLYANCLVSGNTYYLSIDGSNGASGTVEFSIVPISNTSSLTTSVSAPACSNGNGTATVYTGGTVYPYLYSWSNGGSTDNISDLPGTYYVDVMDACGTVYSTSVTIPAYTGSGLTVDAGVGGTICSGTPLQLNATITNGSPLPLNLLGYGYEAFTGDFTRFSLINPSTITSIGYLGLDLFCGDFGLGGNYYALDYTNNQLVIVDTATVGVTIVGSSFPVTSEQWTGLAWNSTNNTFYATSCSGTGTSSTLYSINTTTGAASIIGTMPLPLAIWLAINAQGQAYTLDLTSDNIYQVDLSTAALTTIGYVGFDASYAQDADFDVSTGDLYLAAYNNGNFNAELRIADLNTGNTTLIGTLGIPGNTEVTSLGIVGGATNGFQYQWSPTAGLSNPNIPNPVASPGVTTTYTLTVTDACGTVSDTVGITVLPSPMVNMGPNSNNCLPITLDAGAGTGYIYDWCNGPTTQTQLVSTSGSYCVTVTNTIGCSASDTIDVVIYSSVAAPTINTNITGPNCALGTGTASVNAVGLAGPYTYSWSNGASGSSMSDIPGTYTVTITDVCGTTSASSVVIPVSNTPALVVNAGTGGTICGGTPLQLNASVTGGSPLPLNLIGYGYEVFTGDFTRFSLSNPSLLTSIGYVGLDLFCGDFGLGGNYYALDYTNNQLVMVDTFTATVTVVGSSFPVAGEQWTGLGWNSTNNTFYATSCSGTGTSSTLYSINTATGASSVIGTMPIPLSIWIAINAQGQAYTLDLTSDSIYQVNLSTAALTTVGYVGFDALYAQDADFDASTGDLYLAAYNNSNFNAELRIADLGTGNTTLIGALGIPGNTEITSLGIVGSSVGYQYQWSPTTGLSDPNILNPIANPTVTTTYTLTVTDGCGTVTDTLSITVQPAPIVNLGPDINTCQPVALNAGAGSGYTYSWCNGITTQSQTASTSGIYCVTVSNSAGCTDSDSINVIINPNPVINLGPDVSGCGAVLLNGGTAALTYSWCNGVTGATQTVTTSGMYCLMGINSFGCSDIDSIMVQIYPLPVADAGPDQTICKGMSVSMTGMATNGTAPYLYTWSNGTVVTPTITTTYTLNVSDANGCTDGDNVTINVNQLPVVSAGSDITICEGASATLTATTTSGTAPFTYSWNNNVAGASQVVSPTVTTTYIVTSLDPIGCQGTDDIVVIVNALPPVPTFTQNGNVLTSSAAIGNQWYFNGAIIAGATANTYTATQSGTYKVCVTNADGCISCSENVSLSVSIENAFFSLPISIYPNPMREGLNIVIDDNAISQQYEINIFNYLGQSMTTTQIQNKNVYIPTENWAEGIYSIQFISEGKVVGSAKVVKE